MVQERLPLYGIQFTESGWWGGAGTWATDTTGRAVLYADELTACREALHGYPESVKVKEITPAMYYWLERGIWVSG